MDNRSTSNRTDRLLSSIPVWPTVMGSADTAFLVGGSSMIASAVMPVALSTLVDWAWVTGILLAGVGTLAMVAGLLGLYPTLVPGSPGLARIGAMSAGIAGIAAVGLVSMGVIAAVVEGAMGVTLPKPTMAFKLVALTAAGGLCIGLLLTGLSALRTAAPTRFVGGLLTGGGLVLLLPLVNETLRLGLGVGMPAWIVFPAIGLVSIDAVVIGLAFGSER